MSSYHEDQEFRENVITQLSSINTKMDTLVGTESNKGRVGKLEEKVEKLTSNQDKVIGLGIAWGMFIGIAETVYHYFKK